MERWVRTSKASRGAPEARSHPPKRCNAKGDKRGGGAKRGTWRKGGGGHLKRDLSTLTASVIPSSWQGRGRKKEGEGGAEWGARRGEGRGGGVRIQPPPRVEAKEAVHTQGGAKVRRRETSQQWQAREGLVPRLRPVQNARLSFVPLYACNKKQHGRAGTPIRYASSPGVEKGTTPRGSLMWGLGREARAAHA